MYYFSIFEICVHIIIIYLQVLNCFERFLRNRRIKKFNREKNETNRGCAFYQDNYVFTPNEFMRVV